MSILVISTLSVFSGLAIVYFLRVVTHPLRGYPGPRLAALSGWYMAYFEVIKKGAMVLQAANLHEKYNSTFYVRKGNVRGLPRPY